MGRPDPTSDFSTDRKPSERDCRHGQRQQPCRRHPQFQRLRAHPLWRRREWGGLTRHPTSLLSAMPVTKTDIETLPEFATFLANPARDWSKTILLGLDLCSAPIEQDLLKETPTGAVLIGCIAQPILAAHFASHGALIVPPPPNSTGFDPFRTKLYRSEESRVGK